MVSKISSHKNVINIISPGSVTAVAIGWLDSKTGELFVGWQLASQSSPNKERHFEWDIFMPYDSVDQILGLLFSDNFPCR